jgi:hypothetical protein
MKGRDYKQGCRKNHLWSASHMLHILGAKIPGMKKKQPACAFSSRESE